MLIGNNLFLNSGSEVSGSLISSRLNLRATSLAFFLNTLKKLSCFEGFFATGALPLLGINIVSPA